MRHHHYLDLDSPILWVAVLILLAKCALASILIVAWAAQAVIVFPAAGIAKLCHDDVNARRLTRSLGWLA